MIEQQPGYRRQLRVEPGRDRVVAMLEDDMHAMAVILHHDGAVVGQVDAIMVRAPWTTCPGARAKLSETFAGEPLEAVTARRYKQQNCTHLHDLAVLAASHARDGRQTDWAISVSDPKAAMRRLVIRRDGAVQHDWTEVEGILRIPGSPDGMTLLSMREWIASLPDRRREAARLLQWGGLVAHGRTIPMHRQSRASDLPPNCYTFQPERAVDAVRVGRSHDFSDGSRVLLEAVKNAVDEAKPSDLSGQ